MSLSGKKSIFIVAGEASGDLHGSSVVREIFKRDPSVFIYGVGGIEMEKAGVHLIARSETAAVTGIFEVFFKLRQLLSLFFLLVRSIIIYKPDLAILIDYPDFNLRLAKRLKKRGVPVLYYISPQVWAWRRSRLRQIRKCVTRMLVVFPFESAFYKAAGVDVDFVGHPLLDRLRVAPLISENVRTIALMPGSRKNEVRYLLPAMLESVREIHRRYPAIEFRLVLAPTLTRSDIAFTADESLPIKIVEGPDCLSGVDFVICCSGTATLETALLGKAMVVLYKFNRLTYFLATFLMTSGLKYFALPNIVASRRLVPELLQGDVTPRKISEEVFRFLENHELLKRTSQELLKIRNQLGSPGAASRVAEQAFLFLSKKEMPSVKVRPRVWVETWKNIRGRYFPERASATLPAREGKISPPYLFDLFSPKLEILLLKSMHRIFSPFLWLASCLYGFAVWGRRYFYVVKIFKARKVPATVISIGNITIGGTGKTPFTIFLADEMKRRGRSLAILSRGYKRKAKNAWDCVSDGLSVKLDVLEAGDEPWLMASRLKGVPVYVGGNRYQTAVEILKRHSVDTLLLDDGFQHWGLDRDFDFITFDATTFKESRGSQGVGLLPYGKFREPLGHLKRSNCVILTRTDQLNDIEKERLRREIHLAHPNAPIIEANYRPRHIVHISSGKEISLDHLVGRRILAFAGIGNPESFLKVARQFSQVVDFKVYLDHTFYSGKTMRQLLKNAEKKAVDLILTTEKDAVRIPKDILKSNPPLYALCVDLEITKGKAALDALLDHLPCPF